ncbi:alpha/beta hydrolase [Gordonia sp. TBRC 11910]|uniref:Alpha/beta hydrolase n=1 Tax=Gordonia asplenii TaxID=2725283 RepID=A0A848KPF2_9ACTN|nr:alpha/beta hydrolase [Gordonia asplenii]
MHSKILAVSSSTDVSSRTTGWQPDHLLDNYQLLTFDLGPDPDGEDPITATLVRRSERVEKPVGAVLYVHGFTDYFFQEPLAEFFAARGYEFYAVDLRKCGRSLGEGHTPHFTTNLKFYDVELTLSLDKILTDVGADADVLIAGHSTGGIITPLWLDRLRTSDPARHSRITGLLLNSPWFDLQGSPVLRSPITTAVIKAVAKLRPKLVMPQELSAAYGESLHESAHGEWAYDLVRKPLGGFPVTAGWLNAVRDGHAALHRGLDVGVPSLVLRSDKSHFIGGYDPKADAADIVLDVEQIARWSGCLGNRVSAVPVADARHDVFLSVPRVRERAYHEVDAWLTTLPGAGSSAS